MCNQQHPPECAAQSVPLAEATERREKVRVRVERVEHVLFKHIVGHVEERSERIAGAEELRECGPRIAVELIWEVVGAVRVTIRRSCKVIVKQQWQLVAYHDNGRDIS